jgi:hypothetical protein
VRIVGRLGEQIRPDVDARLRQSRHACGVNFCCGGRGRVFFSKSTGEVGETVSRRIGSVSLFKRLEISFLRAETCCGGLIYLPWGVSKATNASVRN